MCVYVCVCVREIDREKERERERDTCQVSVREGNLPSNGHGAPKWANNCPLPANTPHSLSSPLFIFIFFVTTNTHASHQQCSLIFGVPYPFTFIRDQEDCSPSPFFPFFNGLILHLTIQISPDAKLTRLNSLSHRTDHLHFFPFIW